MADTSPTRPEPPTERPGGYPANGAKVGELPKPPKQATVSPAAEPEDREPPPPRPDRRG